VRNEPQSEPFVVQARCSVYLKNYEKSFLSARVVVDGTGKSEECSGFSSRAYDS